MILANPANYFFTRTCFIRLSITDFTDYSQITPMADFTKG